MNIRDVVKKTIRYALTPFILPDYFKFKNAVAKTNARFTTHFKDFYPQIKDKTIATGFDRHYVFQTGWAMRKVKEIQPKKHVDISSTLFFATTLSAFIPVDFYDYRPAKIAFDNLTSNRGDLLALPFNDSSVQSLSCMHTVEHIGLGRYGEPFDADGDLKAINELKRVVAPGGSLLFVVPIGKPKIEFNAHRIYSYDQIMSYFSDMKLQEFSLLQNDREQDHIIINADKTLADKEHYGCGFFWFKK